MTNRNARLSAQQKREEAKRQRRLTDRLGQPTCSQRHRLLRGPCPDCKAQV